MTESGLLSGSLERKLVIYRGVPFAAPPTGPLRWRPPAPLSPWAGTRKAAALHKQDHRIRREERIMAGQNGGHITRQEQRTLNQPENAVSREIGK